MIEHELTADELDRYRKMGAGGLVEAYIDLLVEVLSMEHKILDRDYAIAAIVSQSGGEVNLMDSTLREIGGCELVVHYDPVEMCTNIAIREKEKLQ